MKSVHDKELDKIYEKIANVIPDIEWDFHAPYIKKINKLKKRKKRCHSSS